MNTTLTRSSFFGPWSFYKRALAVALPVMTQMLIQNFVSLIDNFMVAGLGDIKMSGVNVAGQILFNFMIIVNTICASGGIFMSQFKGANDKIGMQNTLKFKLIVTGLVGISITVICYLAPRGLFGLMVTKNTDAQAILDQTQIYSRAVALSWFFMVLSQSIASSLREIENVKAPLVISVTATLINTFFNWVFIYGNLGAPRLEVAGAGYATVIARASEFVIFLVYILAKKPPFLFRFTELLKGDIKLFFTIFKKSGMILYSELFWAVSETISNALYNTRGGAEVVSGMASGFAVANLFFIAIGGVFTSVSVILGQELGAGNLEQARGYKRWFLSGSAVFGILFMIIGLCTTFLVPIVFQNLTPAAQSISIGLIVTAAVYMPLWSFLNSQYAISRTGGDTTMGVICDTVGNILFIGGMILLTKFTAWGPILMYAVVKLSDIPKMVIGLIWLKKERWLVNLTVKSD